MVVNYRCIGKGVTNSNGVAQMTHSSSDNGVTFTQLANNGYEGVGKGKVDIVASMDKIINSGSVVSEPSRVIDGTFFDSGIKDDAQRNTNWTFYDNSSNYVSVSSDAEGTTLTSDSTQNGNLILANVGEPTPYMTPARDYHYPYCIELDIVEATGTVYIIQVSTTQTNVPNLVTIGANHHLKVWTNESGNVVYYQVDNGTVQSENMQQRDVNEAIGFRIEKNSSIKYKNFVIYPI